MNPLKKKQFLEKIHRTPVDKTNRLNFIRLDKNECRSPLPSKIRRKIQDSVTADFLGCYPEIYKLYESLSTFHGIPQESFLIAAGSDGAIRAAYDAFVETGDEVINVQPNFAMYDVYTQLKHANPVNVFYHPESLAIDVDEIIRHINNKTALIVLSNPNSPTGVEITQENICRVLEKSAEYGVRVLVDEAYYPFSPNTSIGLLHSHKNLIILRTFSKAFGLASLRVGYAVSSKDNIEQMGKFKPMYEVNSMGVICSCIMVENYNLVEESVNEYLQIKKWFVKKTESLSLGVIPSSTNFVNIIVGQQQVQLLVNRFKENRILIRPGFPWGILNDCIRISIGNRTEMNSAFEVLKEWKNAREN